MDDYDEGCCAYSAHIDAGTIIWLSAVYFAPGQNNTRILQNNSNYTPWNGTGLPTTPTGTNYSELNVTGPKEQNVINNTYQEI
ncbi:MAG TPA: hypothetical protein VN455_01385 [Methanotrichaceae archaeon]|nr:hypothetical protein [Methanotrichaceae archaeon]